MGNGQWKIDNGQWKMGNGQWKIDNGQWTSEIFLNEMVKKLNSDF